MEPKPLILFDPHPRPIALLFNPATQARLNAMGRVLWHDGAPASDEHVDTHLPETTILIGQSALPKERLDRAPKLRAVFNVESNFLPNVDYQECQRRGIPVLSTAPVFAQPVAEMALGMALCLARRMHEADVAIRVGRETLYGEGDNHDSILLAGRPMAIVGLGNVGRALLRLLRGFGGEILVHDPWLDPAALREMGVTVATLEECFARCAAVYLTSAVTTENTGGIGRDYFRLMAPGSLVLLISRAGVVNFDELLDEAAEGRLRVGIDVWPEEPIPAGHRARTTPNTMLQAHRAGNIPEIWPDMGRMVTDDIELILSGQDPRHCQRARWETVSRLRSKPVT
ncbi:hydroxyacid dehydrogenase [Verrucomicrobia bacterium LW23]|nr:hydroxyacid dehydrogenase [Verrucomicrobia bacterium LW23]